MKFELDNKSGIMKPKDNPQIYFSRSMSGGLRVDDQINKIKYIIERDDNIKFISGNEKNVNIYDQRMAHVISDRVKKMFGPEHKYSNYKYFTKGYHIVETYDEFINEGILSKTLNRSKINDIRKEDGIKVEFPKGVVILNDKGCGIPYKLNEDDELYYVEYNDEFYFGYEDDGTYTYFVYAPDDVDEEDGKLLQVATSDYDMVTDDFILLRAMLSETNETEGLSFTTSTNHYDCESDNSRDEYIIYDDYDNAKNDAIDSIYQIIDEDEIDKKSFERYQNYFGNDFIDVDAIEELMKEDYESYCNDIENEGGTLGNRLFDELEENELIEDTDEYFETDEDGELDYESPLFNIEDKKEELVDVLCNNYDDPVDWYISNFGTDNLQSYIDKDKLTELIVDSNGVCNSLNCSDEYEFHEDGYDIYIYRR